MGGAPRIIRKVVSPIKKVAPRKLKRRSRKRTKLMATSQNTELTTSSDYSPIRNPRDTGSKLGRA